MIKYILEDKQVAYFSGNKFRKAFNRNLLLRRQKYGKQSQQIMIDDMAENICVSASAIKHWLNNHNGPSDLEKLDSVAEYLQVSREDLLNFENTEENNMNKVVETISTEEIKSGNDSIDNIYASIVGFIEAFRFYGHDNLMNLFMPLYILLKTIFSL